MTPQVRLVGLTADEALATRLRTWTVTLALGSSSADRLMTQPLQVILAGRIGNTGS